MLKKIADQINELSWTLGGTGLVLITLSGQTRTYGVIISVIALVAHLLSAVFKSD
jgi:hypothetical protein